MTFQLSKNELLNKFLWLIILLILAAGVFVFIQYRDYKTAPVVAVAGEQKITEDTPRYNIDITYPLVSGDDSIARYVTTTVSDFKKNASDEENFPEGSSCNQYELNGSYDTTTSEKIGTTSYVYSMYEFTCGAHGNTGLSTFTFNKEGEVLVLEDVLDIEQLTKNSKKIGEELVLPKLKSELGDMYSDEMARAGLFGEGVSNEEELVSINPYSNFIVTDQGITFIFSQYQVAPYAVGMPEVSLTWAELAPYVNPRFDVPLD